MLPRRTFVLGGARSGKSVFAESLVKKHGGQMVYVATAQAFDAEMSARIEDHKNQRGDGWRTIEAPMDIATALASTSKDDVVLLDCATLWLSNQLLAEHDLDDAARRFLDALRACKSQVVTVSNEVGQGIVPENALARRFRDSQGRLNQMLAADADLAVIVAAGLPLVLKGQLP